MPESIITIGEAAFSECKFDAVNIPDGVQEIQRSAFSNNGWLQTVKIGKGIKTIAPNVFFMTALKTIVIEANSIPEADDTSFGDWTYDLQSRCCMCQGSLSIVIGSQTIFHGCISKIVV